MILVPINYKANLWNQAVWRAYQIIQWWRGKKGVRSKLITLILYKPQAYEYQTLYVGGRTKHLSSDKVVDRQGNLPKFFLNLVWNAALSLYLENNWPTCWILVRAVVIYLSILRFHA